MRRNYSNLSVQCVSKVPTRSSVFCLFNFSSSARMISRGPSKSNLNGSTASLMFLILNLSPLVKTCSFFMHSRASLKMNPTSGRIQLWLRVGSISPTNECLFCKRGGLLWSSVSLSSHAHCRLLGVTPGFSKLSTKSSSIIIISITRNSHFSFLWIL